MINVKFEKQFFKNISNGFHKVVLDELNQYPMMLEMISSPYCLLATPILVAANSGQVVIFDMLKSKGANLRRLDAMGNNLLMHAIASNNDQMITKVVACFDANELAKVLVHKNANLENAIEFALKHFPSSVAILLGKRSNNAVNDLPAGSTTKSKALELRSSSQLNEIDDDFQQLIYSLKQLTDDNVKLNVNTEEDEPELVEIIKEHEIRKLKQGLESRKPSVEVDWPEKATAKVKILPVSHPILSQLRHHTKLNAHIQAKIERAVKAAASTEKGYSPSTPG